MLTAEKEGGQLKCHSYWTDKEYGPLKLKPLSERRVALDRSKSHHNERQALGQRRLTNPFPSVENVRRDDRASPLSPSSNAPHIIMRKFALQHTNYPFTPMREITQLQYSYWPDFGAPAHPAHLLGLVEQCDAVSRVTASPALSSPLSPVA